MFLRKLFSCSLVCIWVVPPCAAPSSREASQSITQKSIITFTKEQSALQRRRRWWWCWEKCVKLQNNVNSAMKMNFELSIRSPTKMAHESSIIGGVTTIEWDNNLNFMQISFALANSSSICCRRLVKYSHRSQIFLFAPSWILLAPPEYPNMEKIRWHQQNRKRRAKKKYTTKKRKKINSIPTGYGVTVVDLIHSEQQHIYNLTLLKSIRN